ncbi:hypothetical protein [Aneurinibacillus sp. REN35]|uniref:hypothetical protein n=1 Tax=Aneurinibacillus sp. REN35 TaxID=3237286 RepID=UPI0035278203
MEQITCPYCGKQVTGNHRYEVKCYQCGKYSYVTEGCTADQEKHELAEAAGHYAYAYVPQHVREYADKYGLAQSGPTTLRWFRDHEEEANQKMKQFLAEKLDEHVLCKLHEEHDGTMPFLLYVLDSLEFPVPRASLEWEADQTSSSEF